MDVDLSPSCRTLKVIPLVWHSKLMNLPTLMSTSCNVPMIVNTWRYIHELYVMFCIYSKGNQLLHVFLSFRSRQGVDIVLSKHEVCTMASIIIANPTHVDLLLWAISTHHFSISKANQTTKKSCWEWHPRDKFFPLTNEILCCFHKRKEQCLTPFFQQCFLITFLKQEISKTLQNMEVFRILSWTTIVVLATSQFPSLSDPSPLTT
jgi:hypothetical protein